MKIKETHKNTKSTEVLNNALLKILKDLDPAIVDIHGKPVTAQKKENVDKGKAGKLTFLLAKNKKCRLNKVHPLRLKIKIRERHRHYL